MSKTPELDVILTPGASLFFVLGISPGAADDDATLRAAYRQRAGEAHPDRWAARQASVADLRRANDAMALVNTAYDTLRDAERRSYYLKAVLPRTHFYCTTCAGAGLLKRQRGFAARVAVRCHACAGEGWFMKKRSGK